MEIIELKKVDDVHMKVKCSKSVFAEMRDFFTFEVETARFSPAYRNKKWDGKIRLLNGLTKQIYIGLFNRVMKWAKGNDYKLVFGNDLKYWEKRWHGDNITQFNPTSKGKIITPHDYQINAVNKALNFKRLIIESPTSSGKSLIIYSIIRHMQNMFSDNILLIVPTTSLVLQMLNDFKDYSSQEDWDVDDNCHIIYAGKEKESQQQIFISTWQSLYDMDEEYFSKFNGVIVDEGHLAAAKSIKTIMENLKNCPYKISTTGTLHEEELKMNRFSLEGLFGTVHTTTTTKELMDSGKVSKLNIQCVKLNYTDKEKEFFKPKTIVKSGKRKRKAVNYKDEIDFIIGHDKRNEFIMNLANSCKGNVLVLFAFKEKHANIFYEKIKDEISNRDIFFVHGDVPTEERESIRDGIQNSNNCIVMATYGTFKMGINIPNLQYLIFAHPYKGKIINLQSIGRVLRLDKRTNKATLIDLIDDLRWKKQENYTYIHGIKRLELYNKEKFDFNIRSKSL